MNLAEQSSFLQSLVDRPYDQHALVAVYEALGKDPQAYAELLVTAAEHTSQDVAASHWLTEAARVRMHALSDEGGGVRLLEAALERDPLNMRAAEHLVELYRAKRGDEKLADVLRTRAAALRDRYAKGPVELPRAAVAFEKLSGVYEAIGDSSAAIAALRTALEIERARARTTTPSPPPENPPESSFRTLGLDHPKTAGAPEQPRTAKPEREPRDTLPSPIPLGIVRERAEDAAARRDGALPSSPRSSDPLLAVIEALHALRHSADVVDGATLVLRTALAAIPSSAALVHVADPATRDFVVVAATGAGNTEIIGTRTPEGDPVLARSLREMQAITLDVGSSTALVGARFVALRPKRAVLSAPVQLDGQDLGAIELVDPTGQAVFTDGDRHAMTYVGERFAEFLADRSIDL